MNIIIGTSLLILVLAIFTLFNYKAHPTEQKQWEHWHLRLVHPSL